MNSRELAKEQLDVIARGVGRSLDYLDRLRQRMWKARFEWHDPLFELVGSAFDAVRRLQEDLHRQACECPTKPRRPGDPPPTVE